MKIPRNVSAREFIKSLSKIGYEVSRQKGSHIRLTCSFPKTHHVTIPNHDPIKVGTLSAILADISVNRNQTKEDLIKEIFG
ncbi:MAG: type II toxin-antitoxin system HicA family toxin [Cyclobacteriaceae bacterium]|nr:type II toxin-antitoxin system HicA family toxin [Cyclobacteriaceae bacterium]UYN87374.1 MAG: type II toxin-antitoxin system HicA family toxin [Cyclobacteriaceae bacterium]